VSVINSLLRRIFDLQDGSISPYRSPDAKMTLWGPC
jgi:hypothetical protein